MRRGSSLADYRAKRDFTRSPEPSGTRRRRRATGQRSFCVQKHLASHLHYDFRLEHRGVLRSWAVPKGPSLDPSARRLAMQVEDHPLDYGGFEGVIPSGYGAGIVMLWDRGTWEPAGAGGDAELDAALERGELRFTLHGDKLRGGFLLVRTGGRGGGDSRAWLLIKRRDEACSTADVTASSPDSVASGRDFADILGSDQPRQWQSHRPAASGAAAAMLQEVIEEAAKRSAHRRTRSVAAPRRAAATRTRRR